MAESVDSWEGVCPHEHVEYPEWLEWFEALLLGAAKNARSGSVGPFLIYQGNYPDRAVPFPVKPLKIPS
jgi:hypothetical protein